MTYRERVIESYRQSLLAYGISESLIETAVIAFKTGYNAGILHNSDEYEQLQMETTILHETEVM